MLKFRSSLVKAVLYTMSEVLAMTLGESIKAAREGAGLIEQELAAKLVRAGRECDGRDVKRWESGQNSPNALTVHLIADACGVTSDEILGRVEMAAS